MNLEPPDVKKQRVELEHLELFALHLPEFPGWPVCHENPPGPDFTRMTSRGLVGIEHTRLIVSSAVHRAREALLECIIKRARQIAESHGAPALLVFLDPRDVAVLRKSSISKIADRLARLILDNIPDIDSAVELTLHDPRSGAGSSPIADVSVHRPDCITCASWQCLQVAVVAEDVRSLLQFTLDTKDDKLEGYLSICQECWLLIVAEGQRPSGFAEPNGLSRANEYEFRFARAFFVASGNGCPALGPGIE
jgi:hypothetical protein